MTSYGDSDAKPSAVKESLAIPDDIRAAVDDRDGTHCRVCGKFLGDDRAIHHVVYGGDARGMGGRRHHEIAELITVCWMWPGNCHELVHSNKGLWVPVLLRVAAIPGITALQVMRWQKAQERKRYR